MNETYFEYNIDDIINKLKKGPYNSKKDLLFVSALAFLCFYSMIAIQKFKGYSLDLEKTKNMSIKLSLLYALLGNIFIKHKRKEHTKEIIDKKIILCRFLNTLETLDIFASGENVIESVKEKTKYNDNYYLFDYAGDLQMFTKTELSKKIRGKQETQYKKGELAIENANLELIEEGTAYRKSYPYYKYKLTYDLNGNNSVHFYLDKNVVRIIEAEGPISELKDQFKYIHLKLALQTTNEKDNMRMYQDAFKAKIIKKPIKIE